MHVDNLYVFYKQNHYLNYKCEFHMLLKEGERGKIEVTILLFPKNK